MRTEARFPAIDPSAGHYESFYLKAAPPGGGRALWIRHTIHKRPGQEPTCSIWFTLFGNGGPTATKASFPAGSLSVPDGSYVRVDGSEIGPGRATGSVATEAFEAEWDLRFEDRHDAFRHLPSERMYSAKLPRTKLLSPHPGALFSGSVTIDGERLALDAWPGMVGHNWGAEHAERWIWMHGGEFDDGAPGDFIDVAAGRIKLGPLRTPWIANGSIVIGGEAYRLGGLGRTYGTEITESPTGCEFVIGGKRITVRGRVEAPAERFVGWIYADPDGGEHNTVNCSIADMELRVERPDHKHLHLRVPGGAAYELGMRERDHGIPIQDYPDG
ncbi:MAG TPA: hypothetical protein VKA36_10605 [Solirubrobacterales bacterium]|nr:hypothetical protein [Solirubrobacterales bacterium]